MISFEFTISDTHPSLQGHFPGNPVVPGVVIIDEVVSGLRLKKNSLEITHLKSVKFLKIVKANTIIHVKVTEKKAALLQFVCSFNDSICASGQICIQQAGYE